MFIFLSISFVSASDNETVLSESDDSIEIQSNSINQYNSEIVVKDVNVKYSPYNELNVKLIDNYDHESISGEKLKIIWDDGFEESLYELDDCRGYNAYIDRNVGNYVLTVFLKNSYYSAQPVDVNVKITKANVKLTANKWFTTQGQYATLKVKVKDHNNDIVDEGSVKFTIDGKSYNVRVMDGVAAKKVKLSKAKTFSYKATFYGKNYYSKTVSSKVYVYSISKSARTIKIKSYKIIIPLSKYKKLVNAKNTNKIVAFEIKTNKYFKQKVGYYKTTYKWKYMGVVSPVTANEKGWKIKNYVKHWISDGEYYYTCDAYKKVSVTKFVYKIMKSRVSFVISYGGKYGAQTGPANKYLAYLSTAYQNPGYDVCKPWLYGSKLSGEINKLNKAKVKK